jgi:TRAP-type transport system periplasmic protein
MMRLTSLLSVAAAFALASASTARAENVELRLATLAPSGSPWMEVLGKAQAEIKDKTGGRVTLKYYEGGQQGDERDFVRKIGLGQLDGAAITSIGLAMIDESIRVLELPMMFSSAEELDYVADKMWPYFQKKFEKKGYELGDEGDVGWVYFLSKKKVSTLADLKDQKVWMWGDDKVVQETFKVLGVSGVPLGVPEVDANLTSGKINACYGPPLAAMTLGWASKVKYMTSMPMSYAIGATVIKLDAMKKISADDLKKIKKITKKVSKDLRKSVRKDNKNAEKQMQRKGVQITNVDAAMVADFQKASEQVWKNLVGKVYSQDELDMVLKYRAEYRAKKGK